MSAKKGNIKQNYRFQNSLSKRPRNVLSHDLMNKKVERFLNSAFEDNLTNFIESGKRERKQKKSGKLYIKRMYQLSV